MKTKLLAGLFAVLLGIFGNAWAASEHEASGTINSIDKSSRTLNISHGPIKTMGMAAMTMDFKVADPSMLGEVKPGQKIDFIVTTDRKGRFIIVDLY